MPAYRAPRHPPSPGMLPRPSWMKSGAENRKGEPADHRSADMKGCIEVCLNCHRARLGMAMNYRLEAGGRHLEPERFRLMIACAEICGAAAIVMLTGSDIHPRLPRSAPKSASDAPQAASRPATCRTAWRLADAVRKAAGRWRPDRARRSPAALAFVVLQVVSVTTAPRGRAPRAQSPGGIAGQSSVKPEGRRPAAASCRFLAASGFIFGHGVV